MLCSLVPDDWRVSLGPLLGSGAANLARGPFSHRPTQLRKLTAGQWPFAAVLGCSYSRVPPEFIFDQGLGDLLVVRVAGNIPGPLEVGSVEFGAEKIGARLVVPGHSSCGAVLATLEALQNPEAFGAPDLPLVVDGIRPTVEGLLEGDPLKNPKMRVQEAVRANIRAGTAQLRSRSSCPAPASDLAADPLAFRLSQPRADPRQNLLRFTSITGTSEMAASSS